jgi:glycosyltransferase involved in cell wall biosynthesis
MRTRERWIVTQLGAREHYGVPRALNNCGALAALVTDAWAPPGSPWSRVSPRLSERFSPELTNVGVEAWTARTLLFEASQRLLKESGWTVMVRRNKWFQRNAVRTLSAIATDQTVADGPVTVFAYSYSALAQFRFAKSRGWRTVLGQIDPGPLDAGSVMTASNAIASVPPTYEADWREECRLADHIVVNSPWSSQSLVAAGVRADKLRIVPPAAADSIVASAQDGARRTYPDAFGASRPLRVLFLGNLTRRKGVVELFDAIRHLQSAPVEFFLVGSVQVEVPADIASRGNVKIVGPVSRGAVSKWYALADVFVFPSHSDGFGMTQLEAMAHSLPVIASRKCGSVVTDMHNGLLLDEVTGREIASKLQWLLAHPELLSRMSFQAKVEERFSLAEVGNMLLAV